MAAGRLLIPGWSRALDSDGDPITARVSLFDAGTDALASVFADEALTTPLQNPVLSNSAGRFPAIWASDAVTYDWSVEAPYGPPGSPFTGTGLTTALAADVLVAEAAEAAAEDAEASAVIAAEALADILALAAAAPDTDPVAIANKLNLNGSNIGGNAPALRTAIGVSSTTETAGLLAGKANTDLQNVVYATAPGEIGVINPQYPPGDVRRYGVFPDGTTYWELSFASRIAAIKANSRLFEIHWVFDPDMGGNYATAFNMDNRDNGANDVPMFYRADPGVSFSGILHFISSSTPVIDGNITAVTVGATTTITLASAHGASAGHVRYVVIEGIVGTLSSLNGERVLATPQSTNQFVLAFNSTGLAWTSGGIVNDAKMDVRWRGEAASYNRVGLINCGGSFDGIRMLSDNTKDLDGSWGLGCHIYYGCDNLHVGYIIAEDTDDQAFSANLHGAVAIDAGGANGPAKFTCDRIEVIDSRVNGVVLSGEVSGIRVIKVRAFGRSSPGGAGSQMADFGVSDLQGQFSYNNFYGVAFGRASGRVNSIDVDNEKGFSGRSNVYADVIFDRDHITYTDWNSVFTEDGMGVSVGTLTSRNPKQHVAIVAPFDRTSTHVHIDNLVMGVISDDNVFCTTPALRVARGLVHQMGGHLHINNLTIKNAKAARVLMQDPLAASGTTWNVTAVIENHSGMAVDCEQSGFTKVTIKRRTSNLDTEPSVTVSVPTDRNPQTVVVRAENPGGVNCPVLDFDSQYGEFDVWCKDYRYTGAGSATVVLRSARCEGRFKITTALSPLASSTGFRMLNGVDRVGLRDSLVQGHALGISYTGSVTNLSVYNVTSTGNTVDTDLPAASVREFFRPLLYQDHAGANQTRPAPNTSFNL